MAKAALWLVTDAEARKRGEQTGLDTLVVLAVNDETDLKSKENEEISFNVRSYRSYLFRILWW